MRLFENKTFECFYDRNSGSVFSDLEFRKCRFESCGISITRDPQLRSIVTNALLTQCEIHGSAVDSAILENILIDGLKTPRLFQSWGAVFKHVILKGKIGRVMFSSKIASGMGTEEQQEAFDEANAAFYRTVDWAMDISKAEFDECDLRGVPGHLIRRDPETQVLVTRLKAMQGWQELELSKTYWGVSLSLFLQSTLDSIVLVAPKRSKKFPDLLAGLKLLRAAGIAEQE